MPSCEKCWADSWHPDSKHTYEELLELRKLNPCTPEEQAGPGAGICATCGRRTIHQYARNFCMACNDERCELVEMGEDHAD